MAQLEKAHLRALTLLSRASEYRDRDTGVHMERVGVLSQLLASLMGRSVDEIQMIRVAAPLHDIGKIAVPDAVLKKPGLFTTEERRVMNGHTTAGAEILGQSDIPVFQMAANVALSHHECWDGSGYPNQLRGTQIPWSGRVVALIDFFDALTMDRVYRKAFSDDVALNMMRELRGRKFDPALLDLFMSNVEKFIFLRDSVNLQARNGAGLNKANAHWPAGKSCG